MEVKVTFPSDGLKLAGIVHTPENLSRGERRPAFVILHGFGGNKDGHGQTVMAQQLTEWGYVTMRIDFRGCGESEGEHGRILCLDQVADASNALTYISTRREVNPERVALIGSSFGAAVAIYTGGADSRVAAVISSGGWGNGERKFRRQHPTPEAWERFTSMLEEGRRYRERTGKSLMVPRFDIVPIPERLRGNMSAGSIMEFPAETAQSMYDFRADEMVDKISPRPLLLLHSGNDSVTPTEESIELFKRAKQPAELYLLSDVDHFMFNQENPRVTRLVFEWLQRFFPVRT
jgi:pimeloyl-ACP methyl ester carboxylesterase